jgi:pseudouridine-5'-phosphate glycosidase
LKKKAESIVVTTQTGVISINDLKSQLEIPDPINCPVLDFKLENLPDFLKVFEGQILINLSEFFD